MLEEVLEACLSPQRWDWKVTTLLALVLPLSLTFAISTWNSTPKNTKDGRKPPTLPYFIPYLGHGYSFFTDGAALLRNGVRRLGFVPFQIVLPGSNLYMLSGPDLVSAYFKESRLLSGHVTTSRSMEWSFGTPRHSAAFYDADNSGLLSTPNPDSTTKPEDRIHLIIHNMVTSHLWGESLTGITARFQQSLAQQLEQNDDIGFEWVEIPDFYLYMQKLVTTASLISMFGPYLLKLSPSFVEEFWAFEPKMGALFMHIPKWFDPGAYEAREKALDSIEKYHTYALAHFDSGKIGADDPEWDPYFGSKFSRVRQHTFLKFEALDARARAAEDLGFIWAANSNAVPAAMWMLLEILMDPTLSSRVENIISTSLVPSSSSSPNPVFTFDVVKLCSSPLLQSLYAETLRLRVGILSSRHVMADSVSLRGWHFKRGDQLSVCSSTEAMDTNVWSTGGEGDPHPLDEFWAERFLVYPNDPTSGPRKQKNVTRGTATPPSKPKGGNPEESEEPRFSMEGLSASFIPYGGGLRHCPGRHFAKQEMISAAAIWLSAYETELIAINGKPIGTGVKVHEDRSYFGFGTMPPKEKISCRIRRRKR